MICPSCGADTSITETRPTRIAGQGPTMRRRRLCPRCGERHTSYEIYLDQDRIPRGGFALIGRAHLLAIKRAAQLFAHTVFLDDPKDGQNGSG